MSALTDLLARVEKAEGPDREIDAALWLACFEPTCLRFDVAFHTEQYDNLMSREAIGCDLGTMWVDDMDPPLLRYTAFLDAAVALVERVLPGHDFIIARTNGGLTIHARVGGFGEAYGETPALALLAAMLKAMEEKQ